MCRLITSSRLALCNVVLVLMYCTSGRRFSPHISAFIGLHVWLRSIRFSIREFHMYIGTNKSQTRKPILKAFDQSVSYDYDLILLDQVPHRSPCLDLRRTMLSQFQCFPSSTAVISVKMVIPAFWLLLSFGPNGT